jgi:chromosome segregation protein
MVEVLKDEEVKINRLDVELETKLAHLREEYLLSFEGAKEQYPLALPVEEARKKVKLIKLAIEELGSVNIGAIEEYERVSERYEFLNEQKNDLQEAKDTLYQVIDEMDTEMKKRFEQTFYGIREQFEPVFRALFGGGRADLKLTHPEDLLNTGVEIVAQPPGKKLQNLGLLSGGERALTAIALLFSILKVRPVPFCILDEVEAALDEANVFRFSQYLKRFSSETQFIVITHRKGTMEEADVLYGVTMQESGVSKLVSVRLEDTKELVKT